MDIEGDLPVMLSYSVKVVDENGAVYTLMDSDTLITGDFDLTDYMNTKVTLLLEVTDIRNQTTSVRRQVYVDPSEPLVQEYSVQNEIMDFDGNNILYTNREYAWSPLYQSYLYEIESVSKTEISTGQVMDISFTTDTPLLNYNESFKLLDQGIYILGADSENLNGRRSFIWNPNTNITTEIGFTGIDVYDDENHIVQVHDNSVIGDDLLFSLYVCEYTEISPGTFLQECQPHYFIQKISNPSSINLLDGFHGGENYDSIEKIFTNGGILYYNNDGNIILLNNEVAENITTDGISGEIRNRFVASDGNLYVYVKEMELQDNYAIVLYDGVEQIVLREAGSQFLWPDDFKINNGYITYRKEGNLGQELIMLRKPTGDIVTVAPFGTDSRIEELNEEGEVIFINNNKRYLYTQEDGIFQISNNTLGSPYYFNNTWYISMGNTLFSIDTTSPLSIEDQELTQQEQVIIYPNPAFEEINVKLNYKLANEKLQFAIFNIMGQEVLNGDISAQSNNSRKIDITNLKSGIYFLNILHLGNSITRKIIKE
ncbi:hypothetical protein PHEL85_0514 [Polaribacter sp. Hel1_85]|nr:hypothetical protein PHEL85_0514 [Polaribacter sp. Hel1_85]